MKKIKENLLPKPLFVVQDCNNKAISIANETNKIINGFPGFLDEKDIKTDEFLSFKEKLTKAHTKLEKLTQLSVNKIGSKQSKFLTKQTRSSVTSAGTLAEYDPEYNRKAHIIKTFLDLLFQVISRKLDITDDELMEENHFKTKDELMKKIY